ncbi:MAG: ABC transporter substrate-binding protein [Candidatus Bathyarchaeia archaeon]
MTRPAEENIIKISYTAPFTGPAAEIGTNGWYGIEIALEEINARGIMIGDKKYTIKIIRYDDRCEPSDGAFNVQRLIVEDRVVAILGSHCSSVCMATLPIIQEHGIPTITIECAADALTRQNTIYYFRMRPCMPLMAPSIAKVMVQKLGVTTVSYVAVNDDYGTLIRSSFLKRT